MSFERFHQNRVNQEIRDAFAETKILPSHFMVPFFIVPGHGVLKSIAGLRGTAHVSSDKIVDAIKPFRDKGVKQFLLFGSTLVKDNTGSSAISPSNIVSQAIIQIKDSYPELIIAADICLCAYTDHGHCGIVQSDGLIDNDATIGLLAKMALACARSGVDIVAPSAMMDGQVSAIRKALDDEGHTSVQVMGYSAKFASYKYGPFRGAQDSKPQFGDRKTYQMDFRNGNEAMAEIASDAKEGAEILMVKPALTYLDIVARARIAYPDSILAIYHTSGEFMSTWASAEAGLFPYKETLSEELHSCIRAGANILISYAFADLFDLELPWGE